MRGLLVVALVAACSKPSQEHAPAISSAAPKEYAASASIGTLAPNTGIPVGSTAPDVHARDLDGKDVALSALWSKGTILLAFYRGGWCPYCNFEIHALSSSFAEYRRRGVTPVAVSVDKPDVEAKTRATYAIPFPVLSDAEANVIDAFHVAKTLAPDEYEKMKSNGVDLESQSGSTRHVIAIPALFLIDQHGVVRWAHSSPDFKARPSTEAILAAIDAVERNAAAP